MIIVRRKDGKPPRARPPIIIEEVGDSGPQTGTGARIVDADPDEVIIIVRGPKRSDDPKWRPPIMMFEDEYGPEELARSQEQTERFERNAAWLEAHGDEIFAHHRGKYVCVAGLEP